MKQATLEWVSKAEADYAVAVRETRTKAYDIVCFLAQQCVEKYLKALLQQHGLVFPRTHDLGYLADLATPSCRGLGRRLLEIRRLTDYAVKYRYPGASATAAQKREAMATARRIRGLLRKSLGLA